MPSFAYQARNESGERVSGKRDAADKRAALEELRAMGLFVTQLSPEAVASTSGRLPKWGSKARPEVPVKEKTSPQEGAVAPSTPEGVTPPPMPTGTEAAAPARGLPAHQATPPVPTNIWLSANAKERSLFFRQMHSMLHAGTSVGLALKTMSENAANMSLRRASTEMALATQNGTPWSETMRAYPAMFDALSIGMVAAGEHGGFLDRTCMRLSEYAERDYDLQQTVKRETWYPKLLAVCSILIPSSVPMVVAMFQGGNWFAIWWQTVRAPFIVIVLGVIFWKLYSRFMPVATRNGPIRVVMDWTKLHIPLVSKISRGLAAAKFCRALGALYSAGMGVNRMVDVSAGTAGNAAFASAVRKTIPKMENGQSITDAMASTRQFPGIALQMMRTGEMSGNIDTQLDKVADFLEQDAETAIKQAVKVFGMLFYLVVAAYVGSIVIHQYVGTFNSEMDAGQKMIDAG